MKDHFAKQKSLNNKGFSLVEIVVIIAIMIVLLAILTPFLLKYVENSRIQKDDSAMDEVCHGILYALSDSEIFDEAVSYSIPNNYVTYTDSSGVYAAKYVDEEFWAPDGSGEAVTITFNPDENGTYTLANGLVNDMTYGNGSVAETRVADGLKQCYFSEMGQQKLYHKVAQTIGETFSEKSATYHNSSYTVFITFDVVNGIKRADVYGEWNGTNLSPDCPASLGSGTNSYTEDEEPEQTKTGGTTQSNFTSSDLQGGGGTSGNTPSYKPDDRCVYTSHITGNIIRWDNITNSNYYFSQNGEKWISNNTNIQNTTASSTWTIVVEEPTNYNLSYFVSSESVSYDWLQLLLNGTQVDKIGGTTYSSELTKNIELKPGTNTLVANYRKDGSVNKGQDSGYVLLPSVDNQVETHVCTKHNEEHAPNYQFVENTATCTEAGVKKYKCTLCELTTEEPSDPLGHDWSFKTLPSGLFEQTCNRCGLVQNHRCETFVNNVCPVCGLNKPIAFEITSTNYHMAGIERKGDLIIPDRFVYEGTQYEIKTIGYDAFINCTELTSVIMPDTITEIKWSGSSNKCWGGAFWGCTNLKTVKLSQNLKGSLTGTFMSCKSLESIDIPDGVTQLRWYTFSGCTSLKEINFGPNSKLSSMGSDPISGSGLTEFHLPHSITNLSSYSLNCYNLKTVYYDGTLAEWNALRKDSTYDYCNYNLNIKVVCHDGVTCTTHASAVGKDCQTQALCPTCNHYFGNVGPHKSVNGTCTVCGLDVTVIESEHYQAPVNNNYVVLGTWDYSDAQSVTIIVTHKFPYGSFDFGSIVEGTDYISGRGYRDTRNYLKTNGEIMSTTGSNSSVQFGRTSNTPRTLIFENIDMLTGSAILKTSYKETDYGFTVQVIPNY